MTRQSKDDAFEVSDSTDWLRTPLKSLTPVDAALRCQVCKDFYKTPMITSCAHTFCSICIRRALAQEGKCPACRTADQELKLRNNWSMEELVEAFQKARDEVLKFARKPVPAVVEMSISPKRKVDVMLDREDEPQRKRTRSAFRRPQARSLTETIEIQDSDESDGDYAEEGTVKCPICSKLLKEANINAHLDRNCIDPEEPRVTKVLGRSTGKGPLQAASTKPAKRPERLPAINYSMVKDTALRKRLSDQGISDGGTRQQREKRYSEWMAIWNANCDAKTPKTKSDLRKELEAWERAQGARSHASSFHDVEIRDKDFDGKKWSDNHNHEFQKLIADARRKIPTKSKVPNTDSAGPSTPSAVLIPDSLPALLQITPSKIENEPSESNISTPRPDPMSLDASPSNPSASRRSRFFLEKNSQDPNEPPPSSQLSSRSKA